MCGINGIISKSLPANERRKIILKMNDLLAHRGPDANSTFNDEFIIVLLFVPYIINIDKINLKRNDKRQVNISVDNERKEKIYNSIIIFSTIIWVLTSIVSLKF